MESRSKKKQKVNKIVILGFKSSGKTTLVLQLKNPGQVISNPRETLGINYYDTAVRVRDFKISLIDVGGSTFYQETFWNLAIGDASGVIYMIDGVVKPKISNLFDLSYSAFQYTIKEILPNDKPILVFINKQDLIQDNPLTVDQVTSYYSISDLKDRHYTLIPCSAKYGDNINKGLDWLVDHF